MSYRETCLAVYSGHNASFVVGIDGEIIEIIDLERLFGIKNVGIHTHTNGVKDTFGYNRELSLYLVNRYISSRYNIRIWDKLFVDVDFKKRYKQNILEELFPHKQQILHTHHASHASNVFYQSPYPEAICISADGGGSDGVFNIFLANRKRGLSHIATIEQDLGSCYMYFGEFFGDIKLEQSYKGGSLVYPGKIMGLASYGNPNNQWVEILKQYFLDNKKYSFGDEGYFTLQLNDSLSEKLGVPLSRDNRLFGQQAYDLAASLQVAFEEAMIYLITPVLEKYKEYPVCFSGGCALNVTLNTRLKKQFNIELFVGPSPSDCGVATGALLQYYRPQNPVDVTYLGIPTLDTSILYSKIRNCEHNVDLIKGGLVVDHILDNKIIGVCQGRSEVGPRALGNRSIICNPQNKQMKDILNLKVKHREWYRPFAPIVRLEDVNKFFDWEGESRYMSFAPLVKEQYRELLPAITHVDGTARVQTVTKEQNKLMYYLLTELDRRTGVGVLINTSFNLDGRPLLSSVEEAFYMLENTGIDCLIVDNFYIQKNVL